MEMNGCRQQTDVLEQEIKHHECRTKRLRLLAELQVWGNEDLLKDGLISSEPGVLQMIIVPPLCWRLRVLNASPSCPRWAGRKQRVSLFHVKLKRRMRSYTHCSHKTKASCWRRPQLLRQPWMAALRFETNWLKECSAGCSFWVMWPRMAGARPRTKAYITSAMEGGEGQWGYTNKKSGWCEGWDRTVAARGREGGGLWTVEGLRQKTFQQV